MENNITNLLQKFVSFINIFININKDIYKLYDYCNKKNVL